MLVSRLRSRLLPVVLCLAAAGTLATGGAPTANAASAELVHCLDRERQLVLRSLPWECEGEVLSDEQARRWRERIRSRRVERVRQAETGLDAPSERPGRIGTAFRVDGEGHLLTNRHVVEGCRRLRLRQDGRILGPARLVALHPILDVALLDSDVGGAFARFAAEAPGGSEADGEALTRFGVVGYPREGVARVEARLEEVVARAASGAGQPYISFLGTVRPGNSGSPLLDARGRVVGLVTAMRDRVDGYARTGELPPAGGLALAGEGLRRFLEGRGVAAATAPATAPQLEPAALLAEARRYVVRVDCWP